MGWVNILFLPFLFLGVIFHFEADGHKIRKLVYLQSHGEEAVVEFKFYK